MTNKRKLFLRPTIDRSLQGKPFKDFQDAINAAWRNREAFKAIEIAKQAAVDYGAAGLYLLYQANDWLRTHPVDDEEMSQKELYNMLVWMILGQKLCDQDQENLLFQYYFPDLTEKAWQKIIDEICRKTNLSERKEDASIAANDLIPHFVDNEPLSPSLEREILIDRILPAKRKILSENLQTFFLLNAKAFKDANPTLTVEKNNVSFNGGYVESAMIKTVESPNRAVIHCRGNNEAYQEVQGDLMLQAKDTNALVVGFNYPSVLNSSKIDINTQVIVDSIKAMVNEVHNKTHLPYSDITLQAHSLGAGYASIAALQLHQEDKPVRLVNSRSFSSLLTQASQSEGFMAKAADALNRNSDLMIDSGAAYLQLPNEYKMVISAENDLVIPASASLLKMLCDQQSENAAQLQRENQYHCRYDQDSAHNCNLGDLIRADKRTAQQVINEFINKSIAVNTLQPSVLLPK